VTTLALSNATEAPGVRAAETLDTDEALLTRFAKGDCAALEILARRLERPMLGLACGLFLGRRDLAADAVQETWVRVIKSAATFRGNSSASTWIYRILINRCHTLRDKHKLADRGCHALTRGATNSELATDADRPASKHAADPTTPDPEDLSTLRTAVATLDESKRELLLLCYHAGLTHPQAAEILSIPVGTLKSRLHSALNELRTLLQPSTS
jgi:RNA polymerase sigma-70 factor, ECF subfamily